MLSLASFAVKRADTPYAAGTSPEFSAYSEGLKAQALRRLLLLGLLSTGVGAGTGLLTGALSRKRLPPAEDVDVDLPYPAAAEKQGAMTLQEALMVPVATAVGSGIGSSYGAVRMPKDRTTGALSGGWRGGASGLGAGVGQLVGHLEGNRLAEGLWPGAAGGWRHWLLRTLARALGGVVGERSTSSAVRAVGGPPPWEKQSDWADAAVRHLLPTPAGQEVPSVGTPHWWRGDTQAKMWSLPWLIPAAAAVAGGGLYGGHHLVRHLLRKKRKAALDAEVEAARKEYEEAMLGQYDPEKVHKLAAVNRLDATRAAMEKSADFQSWAGKGAGLYLLAAAILSGMMGYGSYQMAKGRSQAKVLNEALKQRALARQAAAPPNIYLHPTQLRPAALPGPAAEDEAGAAPAGLTSR
jgi:hypothetical protein